MDSLPSTSTGRRSFMSAASRSVRLLRGVPSMTRAFPAACVALGMGVTLCACHGHLEVRPSRPLQRPEVKSVDLTVSRMTLRDASMSLKVDVTPVETEGASRCVLKTVKLEWMLDDTPFGLTSQRLERDCPQTEEDGLIALDANFAYLGIPGGELPGAKRRLLLATVAVQGQIELEMDGVPATLRFSASAPADPKRKGIGEKSGGASDAVR